MLPRFGKDRTMEHALDRLLVQLGDHIDWCKGRRSLRTWSENRSPRGHERRSIGHPKTVRIGNPLRHAANELPYVVRTWSDVAVVVGIGTERIEDLG